MVHAQTTKIVPIISPQAIKDNVEFVGSKGSTPVQVDTLGFDYAVIRLMLGATDIAMATVKLWECDTLGGTYTAVSGGAFTTLPSATDDNLVFAWLVNLANRKRYLEIEVIPGDGTTGSYAVAWAELSRAEQMPSTAALRGHAGELVIN